MIKGKPDVSQFLEGGKAESKPALPVTSVAKKATEKPVAVPKKQKLVELPEPVYTALKDRAYNDFKKTGRRVTETEIIIAAIKKYLSI